MVKLKEGEAVRVSWYDSIALNGWRYSTEGLGKAGRIQTIGYVAHNTNEAVSITSSIGKSGGFLDPISIPWKAVEKLEKLGEEWNR